MPAVEKAQHRDTTVEVQACLLEEGRNPLVEDTFPLVVGRIQIEEDSLQSEERILLLGKNQKDNQAG